MNRDARSDPFRDRLSDYADDALSGRERDEVDEHLASCLDCRALIGELRSLRREARALLPFEPPEHVWQSISARINARERSRARQSHFNTGLSAAAALVLGVSLWIALTATAPRDPRSPNGPNNEELADMVTQELLAAESHYQNAITGLEQIVAQNDGTLPSELNQTLIANLDLIERTIDESRNAIATNPESSVAKESLFDAFRRKVNLLQNTILLINEVRKGEGENALELIDEIRETEDPSNTI
jgi:hypothetical protein